jgi:hypothetical protein
MTNDERLADVPGTAGAYRACAVSGEIIGVPRRARTENQWGESTRRVPARVLSRRMHSDGRATVQICIDGQPRNILVANAVLEAFVGPRPRGHYAEFRNGDPTDCRLSNLYWRKQDWGGRGRKLKTLDNGTAEAA